MAKGNKTHRGAVKRFRKVASGYKRKQSGHRHLLDHRTMKSKRNVRSTTSVHKDNEHAVARMLCDI